MNDITNSTPDGGQSNGRDLGIDKEVAVQRLPCDGVPRFKVRGARSRNLYPYAVAYDGVFISSGCKVAPDGKRLFTREGLERIANLNRQYLKRAEAFVVAELEKQNAKLAEVMESAQRVGHFLAAAKEGRSNA